MRNEREIGINNEYEKLIFETKSLIQLFHFLDTAYTVNPQYTIPAGELSIALVDDLSIAQIHADFMDDPTPTDVITFPGDPAHDFAGEICVSVDHAIALSNELKLSVCEELTLYLVHGWLHLAGFDDIDPVNEKKMRAAEKEVMELLRNKEMIPNFVFLK